MGACSNRQLRKFVDWMEVPVYVETTGVRANKAVVKFQDLCSRLAKRVYVENAGRRGVSEEELSQSDQDKLKGCAGTMQFEAKKTKLTQTSTWSEHVAAVALQQLIRSYKARKSVRAKVEA